MLHSLGQAGGIGLHVNADKTEFMWCNQKDNSIQNGDSLKLVDKFAYFECSFLSPENHINIQLAKECTAIDR